MAFCCGIHGRILLRRYACCPATMAL
jgi:hypothetical protein